MDEPGWMNRCNERHGAAEWPNHLKAIGDHGKADVFVSQVFFGNPRTKI